MERHLSAATVSRCCTWKCGSWHWVFCSSWVRHLPLLWNVICSPTTKCRWVCWTRARSLPTVRNRANIIFSNVRPYWTTTYPRPGICKHALWWTNTRTFGAKNQNPKTIYTTIAIRGDQLIQWCAHCLPQLPSACIGAGVNVVPSVTISQVWIQQQELPLMTQLHCSISPSRTTSRSCSNCPPIIVNQRKAATRKGINIFIIAMRATTTISFTMNLKWMENLIIVAEQKL